MPLSEHVYCVAIAFKMTEPVEQQIRITFCIKLEHSSAETTWMIQKAVATGHWWMAASSQHTCPCIMSHAELFGKTSNHPGDSALHPSFGTLWLLAFPKTRITFEREEISDCWWDSEKYSGAADSDWENVWAPKVPTLKGTEASLSYVQCFLYHISSISVSIFHTT